MPAPTPPAIPSRTGPRRLDGLQFLRAAAAVAVLLYHAAHYTAELRGGTGGLPGLFDGRFGLFGVTLFFVISGYLMASLADTATPGRFLCHRMLRIYPTYWLVAGGVWLARAALEQRPPLDPLALLLIPGPARWYVLGIEWTLPFEILFYVAVFGVILLRAARWLPALALAWLALLVLARALRPEWESYTPGGMFPTLSYLLLSEKCVGFVLGLLLPPAARWLPGRAACLALGAAVTGLAFAWPWMTIWTMAAGSALLVAAATRPAGTADEGSLPRRALLRLGDWSFMLYLVHVPVAFWVLRALPEAVGPLAAWLAVVLVALAVCAALGPLDLSLYRVLKRAADRAAAWPRALLAGLFLLAFLAPGVAMDLRLRRERALRADAAVLGAALSAAQGPLEARLAAQGLRPAPELMGHLDRLEPFPGTAESRASGWMLDRSGAPLQLLFLRDGQFLGSAVPAFSRPDVLEALRLRGSDRVGFLARLPGEACAPGSTLAGLLVAGGRYAMITIPEGALRCDSPPGR